MSKLPKNSNSSEESRAERAAGQVLLSEDGRTVRAGRAIFGGENEEFRYRLERWWEPGERPVLFLMLNPSIATEVQDDPTIRRCRGFARDWGYGGYIVCNIFALRSTDPSALYSVDDPVGPENDEHILRASEEAGLTVAAWGVHGAHQERGQRVVEMLTRAGRPVVALGLTKAGFPRHPLYVRADAQPVSYPPMDDANAPRG